MNSRLPPAANRKGASKGAKPNRASGADKIGPSSRKASNVSSTAPLPNSGEGAGHAFVAPERRRALIAEAAYFRAERRGFEPGHELEDWCSAEGEIDGKLTRGEMPALTAPAS